MKRPSILASVAGVGLCLAPPLRAGYTPNAATFQSSQLAHWIVGKPWSAQFSTDPSQQCTPLQVLPPTGGETPLPSNIVWTTASTGGQFSGAFASPGFYGFALKATCVTGPGSSITDTSEYDMDVEPAFSMLADLTPANAGVPYSVNLAHGGVTAFSATLVSGSLPPGLSLVGAPLAGFAKAWRNGAFLEGTPTTQGAYAFQVSVTDGLGETGTQSYVLLVGAPGALFTTPAALAFSAAPGAAPQTKPLLVAVGDLSSVSFTVTSDAAWLTATPSSTSTPGSITVRVDPSQLELGTTPGHLTLTASGKTPVTVTVTAVVQQAPPSIATAPDSAEVDMPADPDASRIYQIEIHAWNPGSGTVNVQVSATASELNWLTAPSGQVTLTAGQMQAITATVDGAIPAGTYQSSIVLSSSAMVKTIPVTMVVPARQYKPTLRLDTDGYATGGYCFSWLTGVTFDGSGCHPLYVYNDAPRVAMDFTATLTGFGGKVVLDPAQGHIDAGSVSQADPTSAMLGLNFNPADLGVGRHEGLLTVTAPGADGSPAHARIRLDISAVPNGSTTGTAWYVTPDIQMDYPILVSPASTAHLKISNPTNVPVPFTVASPSPAVTFDFPTGIVEGHGNNLVTLSIDTQKDQNLSADQAITIAQDMMTKMQMSGVQVPQVIKPTASSSALARAPAPRASAATCAPARLIMAPAGPPVNFSRYVDSPQAIGAVVFDDCGNPVANAFVSASFSNGDASIALPLSSAAKGLYRATWYPGAAADNLTIALRASRGTLTSASSQIFGSIVADAGAPVISSILNSAAPAKLPVAGGTIAISGSNLAGTGAGATSVLIGGVTAALLSVNTTQVVAKVPASLAPSARYEVAVLVNDRVATPKPLVLGPAPSVPAPAGVGPPSGTGMVETFNFNFSDSGGWQNLSVVDVLIASALDGRHACYIAFVPSAENGGSLYLVDDAGDAGGPYSGMSLPGSGRVSNSQCSIAGADSSAYGSNTSLNLRLAIAFAASFSGNKVFYLAAQDSSGTSGWQAMGTWSVPGTGPGGPGVAGVFPARTGDFTNTFTFTFNDTNGWQDIAVVDVLIASAIDGRTACYLAFVPSGANSGSVYLVDAAGDAAGPYTGFTLPFPGAASNSQCTVGGAGSAVAGSGNTLTLTLPITFSQSFTGTHVVYLAARSNTANSGWQPVGTAYIQ